MIFLDTNICIYVMRGAPSALLEKFDSFSGQRHVCSIVVAELEFAVINSLKKERNARALEALLERLGVIDWDRACAKAYARVRFATRKQAIGPEDTMIAACALAHESLLVTNITDEFGRVPRLVVEN